MSSPRAARSRRSCGRSDVGRMGACYAARVTRAGLIPPPPPPWPPPSFALPRAIPPGTVPARSLPGGGSTVRTGTVDRDGFQLAWVREGQGIPMLVLGASRFYPRYFPAAMRDHFDMVCCDLRQWVPTPDGFDIATITRDTFSD